MASYRAIGNRRRGRTGEPRDDQLYLGGPFRRDSLPRLLPVNDGNHGCLRSYRIDLTTTARRAFESLATSFGVACLSTSTTEKQNAESGFRPNSAISLK